jgi:hypothetical protein
MCLHIFLPGGYACSPARSEVELLKVVAHPVRIKILEDLTQGVKA